MAKVVVDNTASQQNEGRDLQIGSRPPDLKGSGQIERSRAEIESARVEKAKGEEDCSWCKWR